MEDAINCTADARVLLPDAAICVVLKSARKIDSLHKEDKTKLKATPLNKWDEVFAKGQKKEVIADTDNYTTAFYNILEMYPEFKYLQRDVEEAA